MSSETGDLAWPDERRGRLLLASLIVLGIVLLGYYLSWWFQGGRYVRWELALLLAFAGMYALSQLITSWMIYLFARRRSSDPPPIDPGLTVDVFITSCGEPPELVRRSLEAAIRIRGSHRTWLLDDGDGPRLERLAALLGAGYLTRSGDADHKAGNVNMALEATEGDVVVIFDVDHVPEPAFLERSLGHFRDPAVGFVQVMLDFSNGDESWIARAAAESASDYYNPTCIGADGLGGASLVGTNALIRRAALVSIGGYRPGLAEDLATSLALHSAGWRSVYVAEPLAPGLVPTEIRSWFVQQMKWSRGVFELLLKAYPRVFPRLTWGQRLSYLVRMTYYWLGVVVAIHLIFLIALLLGGSRVAQIDFNQYLLRAAPLFVCVYAIRLTAMWFWRHPSTKIRPLWRSAFLVSATWPIYLCTWVMALARIPLPFRATPKSETPGTPLVWILPQIAASGLLVLSLLHATLRSSEPCPPALYLFAFLHLSSMGAVLWQAFLPPSEGTEAPILERAHAGTVHVDEASQITARPLAEPLTPKPPRD